MNNLEFNIYLIFTISWFLHLGSRVPILGLMRFDLLLVCILFFFILLKHKYHQEIPKTQTDKLIRVIIIYVILTIPLVEWPGSVIRFGIPNLVKAVVFYYFTVSFIYTEIHLKRFLLIFIGCQLFRIIEPLYLHITQGYWGSFASMANWEYLDRLSGAPSDTVNPNGLAFIICTVLPFIYYTVNLSWINRLASFFLIPICIYTLMLTGSRTGFIGLMIIFLVILAKSKHRLLLCTVSFFIVFPGFFLLDTNMQDRYLSIIGMGEKNEATAEGRMDFVEESFIVALRRPIFGHGISTSREANANYAHHDQLAHNLYAEVAQELGFIGVIIILLLIKSIFSDFTKCKQANLNQTAGVFLSNIINAMQVWLWLNVIFSFASYGLTSYEWYLLSGFSVVMQRLTRNNNNNNKGL